jgi:ABC-type oligopeptide transport system substrate-binding subunit
MKRSITAGLTVLASMAFLVAACGGNDSSTTTGATTTTSTTTSETTTNATPPPANPSKTIRIVVKEGKVVGGLNQTTVDKNTNVTVIVSADVSDEVHIHGYDLMKDVAPGKPAKITFVANIPGRFEMELENRALKISDFEVSA